MPTWGEIQEHARSKYKLDDDEDDWFSLVFAYDNGRTQKVWVRRFTSFDMEWAEFRSAVCKESEMSHRVALKKNLSFSVGALALDEDGDYVFLYSAPLPTMDPEEFELPLHVVAHTADRLESEFSAGDDEF
jgi:hypothetical protein